MTTPDESAKLSESVPEPEDSIALLEELIRMWESHSATIAVPVIDGSLLPGVAIQVQVEHAVRLSEAVIVLSREGLFIQLAPLVRLALECAVSAAWWTLHPNNVKASVNEAARLKNLLMEGMNTMSEGPRDADSDWESISAEFAQYHVTEARNFEQRCNALAGGTYLYPYYRLLSEASHGGTALIEEYMVPAEATPEQPTGLAFQRHAPYKHRDLVLGINVIALALAIRAWDDITVDHPLQGQLNDIATRTGANIVIAPATQP